jgi:hypothetical protein
VNEEVAKLRAAAQKAREEAQMLAKVRNGFSHRHVMALLNTTLDSASLYM